MGIQLYDGFFSDNLFDGCQEYSLSNLTSKAPTFSTNNLWPYSIVKDSAPILANVLDENDLLAMCIRNEVLEKIGAQPLAIAFMYFYSGSHIPWHNDHSYEMGLTIYLNEEWDRDFAGLFVYEEDNELKAITPKRNRAVKQTGHIWHSVTPTTKNADIRRSIQLFFE